jgi:hypothetical protein
VSLTNKLFSHKQITVEEIEHAQDNTLGLLSELFFDLIVEVEVKDQVSNLASTDRALVVLVVINSIGILVVILGLAFVFARFRGRRSNAVCSI